MAYAAALIPLPSEFQGAVGGAGGPVSLGSLQPPTTPSYITSILQPPVGTNPKTNPCPPLYVRGSDGICRPGGITRRAGGTYPVSYGSSGSSDVQQVTVGAGLVIGIILLVVFLSQ